MDIKKILEKVKEQLGAYGEEEYDFSFYGPWVVKIVYDEVYECPLTDWDHPIGSGIDLSNHRDYRPDAFGTEAPVDVSNFLHWVSEGREPPEDDEFYDGISDFIEFEEEYYWTPVHMYDHSGRTVNTTGFACRWDSGVAGIAFLPKKTLVEEGLYGAKKGMPEEELNKKAAQFLKSHVLLLDDYLKNNVFGFEIEYIPHNKDVACYGFWSDEGRRDAVEEALSSLKSMLEEVEKEKNEDKEAEKLYAETEQKVLADGPEVTITVNHEGDNENKVCLLIAGELRDTFPTYESALRAANHILMALYCEE